MLCTPESATCSHAPERIPRTFRALAIPSNVEIPERLIASMMGSTLAANLCASSACAWCPRAAAHVLRLSARRSDRGRHSALSGSGWRFWPPISGLAQGSSNRTRPRPPAATRTLRREGMDPPSPARHDGLIVKLTGDWTHRRRPAWSSTRSTASAVAIQKEPPRGRLKCSAPMTATIPRTSSMSSHR